MWEREILEDISYDLWSTENIMRGEERDRGVTLVFIFIHNSSLVIKITSNDYDISVYRFN